MISRTGGPAKEPPSDYLSDTTRKVRRALLFACVAGLAYVSGFKPTELTALGMKLDIDQHTKISWLLMGVIGYFLLEFLTFVRKDYVHLLWGQEQYPVLRAERGGSGDPYELTDRRLKWEFKPLRFRTPAMFRGDFIETVLKATRFYTWLLRLRSGKLAGLGQRLTPIDRPNVLPIPRYGFQSFLDFWFPFVFGLITMVFVWLGARP